MTTNSWVGGSGPSNFGSLGPNTDWSLGNTPDFTDDAIIYGSIVEATSAQRVGSISLGTNGILAIVGTDFTTLNGTGPNVNSGYINVNPFDSSGSDLIIGNGWSSATFDSSGTVSPNSIGASPAAALSISGSVNLTGSGSIQMRIGELISDNLISGVNSGTSNLTNESEDISGSGTIGGDLNVISGTDVTIETNNSTSSSGGILNIEGSAAGGSFTNNGVVQADNGGALILGVDGESGTIVNNYEVNLDGGNSTPNWRSPAISPSAARATSPAVSSSC